jgi:hypothetical protein
MIEVITCPSCGTKVKVPTDRGRLKIKCRVCETRWFYPATINYSDANFRCARDGAHFTITLSRSNPEERFKINRIFAVEHGAVGLPAREGGQLPGRGLWLAVLPWRNRQAPLVSTLKEEAEKPKFSAADYNWAGFYCPCCGYKPDHYQGAFVHCPECNELVCQGTVVAAPGNQERIHKCHPSCGGSGVIRGSIQEYSSERRSMNDGPEFAALPSTKLQALPKAHETEPATNPKRLAK